MLTHFGEPIVISILSVNRAEPRNLFQKGETIPTGMFKKPVEGQVQVGKLGLQQDTIVHKHVHGGPDQALYLYSEEDYDWWETQLGKPLTPGLFAENLTVKGVDLSECKVGDRFVFDDVVFEVTGPRIPCGNFANRMEIPSFVKQFAQAGRPGVYVRVIDEGQVEAGISGAYHPTKEDYVSIRDLFIEWHRRDRDQQVLQKALNSPLSEHLVKSIKDWL